MQNLLDENQDLLEYYHELARNYADNELTNSNTVANALFSLEQMNLIPIK